MIKLKNNKRGRKQDLLCTAFGSQGYTNAKM